ncbi:MAG TPA: hypothetical protein VD866_02980 [Urbifossiella sp.]|nr:hypothetical protein [Urbifossiella sp.]
MTTTLPDPDAGLVERLCAGDPLAASDFCVAHLNALVEQLRRSYPTAHEHALSEAAEDALLAFVKNPQAFDPARGTVAGYLRMAAKADLINIQKKEARHHRDRTGADCVEDAPDPRNELVDEADGPSFADHGLAAVIAGFTDVERLFFDLMRDGEKRTQVLAVVLGLADAAPAEQTTQVKKMRDCLIKRLQRRRDGP